MMKSMMYIFGLFLLHTLADSSLDKQLRQHLDEITSYDQFMYQRYLKTEETTCFKVSKLSKTLPEAFFNELHVPLSTAQTKYKYLLNSVRDSAATKCIKAIYPSEVSEMISEETKLVRQCIDGVKAKQAQSIESLKKVKDQYVEDASLAGEKITTCFTLFTSNSEETIRDNCVDDVKSKFHGLANVTVFKHFNNSPCMENVIETVNCLTEASNRVTVTMETALKNMFNCVNNVQDHTKNKYLRNATFITNFNLLSQMKLAQRNYTKLNDNFEKTLRRIYDLKRKADSIFLKENDNPYEENIRKELQPSFDTLVQAQKVNPTPCFRSCAAEANHSLVSLILPGSKSATKHRSSIYEQTQALIKSVRQKLTFVTEKLPSLGNSAISDCMTEGLVFKTNALTECYKEKLQQFELVSSTTKTDVERVIKSLEEYNIAYFKNKETSLHCSVLNLNVIYVRADSILHKFGKCLYQTCSTDYAVEVPSHNLTANVSCPLIDTCLDGKEDNYTDKVVRTQTLNPNNDNVDEDYNSKGDNVHNYVGVPSQKPNTHNDNANRDHSVGDHYHSGLIKYDDQVHDGEDTVNVMHGPPISHYDSNKVLVQEDKPSSVEVSEEDDSNSEYDYWL